MKTGALVSLGNDELPVDGSGEPLELATLQALERLRYSVPMWYPDYDGYYWSDGRTLDVEGGDYQVIEYLRIVDKVARRVRLLAIARVADRSLNTTPGSIAAAQLSFAKPLREMSLASQTPLDGDISIVWSSAKQVAIYMVVRPVECPKDITVSLVLDTSITQESAA